VQNRKHNLHIKLIIRRSEQSSFRLRIITFYVELGAVTKHLMLSTMRAPPPLCDCVRCAVVAKGTMVNEADSKSVGSFTVLQLQPTQYFQINLWFSRLADLRDQFPP
jgi:hypothetical protein